jgi:enoyl-CoA hydratase/carnithine racemase
LWARFSAVTEKWGKPGVKKAGSDYIARAASGPSILLFRNDGNAGQADKALAIAELIANNNPYSVTKTKQLMWQHLEAPSLDAAVELENHVQTLAMLTKDFSEALTAFGEKRPPVFRNE